MTDHNPEEAAMHTGRLLSGEVTCSCGWKSGHFALASDACDLHDAHIAQSECSCAMTEGSQRTCPLHGEDEWLDPYLRDGATDE